MRVVIPKIKNTITIKYFNVGVNEIFVLDSKNCNKGGIQTTQGIKNKNPAKTLNPQSKMKIWTK